jgi:transcriptional regulator with XRE-family HTH domain
MSNDDLKRLFGLRVQALRRRCGLTQEALAEAIERSVDTVSNIERGFSSTRIETAQALAEALGVTLPELFEFGHAGADREHRRAVEQIVGMLVDRDDTTIQAVVDVVRIVLRLREHSEGERP